MSNLVVALDAEEIRDALAHVSSAYSLGKNSKSGALVVLESSLDQDCSVALQGRQHSSDGSWIDIESCTVTAGAANTLRVGEPWREVRVHAQCSVSPSSGSLNAWMSTGDLSAVTGTVTANVSSDATRDNGTVDALQAVHDNLNLNANLQVGDSDVDSSNPVPVKTRGDTIVLNPTVTAGAYAAGDAVGGKMEVANAARESGGGGVVKSVCIIDDAGNDFEGEIWIFNDDIAEVADNAAWSTVAEADLHKLAGVICTNDSEQGWLAAATPSTITIERALRYDCVATSLYVQLVDRTGATFSAVDDVTIILGLLQD